MGLFETIFGSSGQNAAANDFFDSRTQNMANQAFNSAYNQYAQQQSMNSSQSQLAQQAYNQQLMGQYHMMRNQPKWVYNGVECTLKEFADLMYNDDEQAKLMFILKHGGV